MLNDINLDAIPSGETRAAILILVGRLQALEAQVKALVAGDASAGLTGNVSSEAQAATPAKPGRGRRATKKESTS